MVDYEGEATRPLVRQIIKEIYLAGAFPYVTSRDSSVNREIMLACNKEQLEFLCEYKLAEMKGMEAYIAIRGIENAAELSDVPSVQTNLYMRELRPLLDYRVNHTKWVVLRYPNPSMAQLANTSQEAFEDFYFDVCTIDYEQMGRAMDPLVELMNSRHKIFFYI